MHIGLFNFITLIFPAVKLYASPAAARGRVSAAVFGQVCGAVGRCVSAVFPCVSVCLAALFLILGVDILEDKGPI